MSEGSSFGIVPYIKPSATGTIAGVVGAGGNTGAVIWGLMFRFAPDGRPAQDTLMYIGFIVLIAAASCPFLFLETQPGMFGNPRYNAAGTKTAKLHLASDEQLKVRTHAPMRLYAPRPHAPQPGESWPPHTTTYSRACTLTGCKIVLRVLNDLAFRCPRRHRRQAEMDKRALTHHATDDELKACTCS